MTTFINDDGSITANACLPLAPPMTTTTDVAAVARGLTKGQRAALVRHRRTYGTHERGWPEPSSDPSSFCYAGRHLMEIGLIKWTPKPRSSATIITPLGLLVRQHIVEEGGLT